MSQVLSRPGTDSDDSPDLVLIFSYNSITFLITEGLGILSYQVQPWKQLT